MIESLLLTTVRIATFDGKRPLTGASGFFFEREGRLFLVTSRHVVIDQPSKHFPNRIEIELHTDAKNLTRSTGISVPLYRRQKCLAPGQRYRWRDRRGGDRTGSRGIAAVGGVAVFHAGASATLAPGGGSRHLAPNRWLPARFPRRAAPLACGAAGGHRLVLRPALPGLGLLSHRCANAPRHQRRAGGDAQPGHRCATALEAARCAFRAHGHDRP